MNEEISKLKQDVLDYGFHLKTYFILFQHAGNSTGLPEGVQALREYFASAELINGERNPAFGLRLLFGSNPEQITQNVISAITLDKRTAMLSR